MKILILQDDFPPVAQGGAGIVAFRLAQAMQAQGHEVLVVTTTQEKGDQGRTHYQGLTLHRIYANFHIRWMGYLGLYNPQTVGKVRKIFADFKPDVVHAHNVHRFLSYHCLKLAKKSGAKVILTAHDAMLVSQGKVTRQRISFWQQMATYRWRFNPLRTLAIQYYLKFVDQIVAVSEALKEVLAYNGIRGVRVIHNGIDSAQWSIGEEAIARFRERQDLMGKKVILFGGRLSQAKGGNQAILALKEIVVTHHNTVLLVMGEKNYYAKGMLTKADMMGITDCIRFTGWISGDELKAAYGVADVVLVPSLYIDPFPTVNLEAMAAGKPVVGTCLGGTPEAVQSGITGFIVDPHDTHVLAGRIGELLSDSERARAMGARGRQRVESEFSIIRQTDAYCALFS